MAQIKSFHMFHLLQTAVYAPGDEIYKKKKKTSALKVNKYSERNIDLIPA